MTNKSSTHTLGIVLHLFIGGWFSAYMVAKANPTIPVFFLLMYGAVLGAMIGTAWEYVIQRWIYHDDPNPKQWWAFIVGGFVGAAMIVLFG